MRYLVSVVIVLLLFAACSQSMSNETTIELPDTGGCAKVVGELTGIVGPSIVEKCEETCAEIDGSFSRWQCAANDNIECVCSE